MEKFYTVSPESPVYQQYFDYDMFTKEISKLYTEFADEHGIETTRFWPDADEFMIDPTEADKQKFHEQMRKDKVGLFKKNSAMNKAWLAACKDRGIVTRMKPFLPFVFNTFGRVQFRLFHIDTTLYCTFESKSQFDNPPLFNELKASEFYKIMEDAGLEMT